MQDLTKNNLSKKLTNTTLSTIHSLNIKNKVAIYHTGALGDLLVSTAAVYESIQFFPQAEFTLIGSKLWKEVITPNIWPNIKFILEVGDKKFTKLNLWKSNTETNSWEECKFTYLNIIKFLKNFDVTIDLRTESIRFAWRAWLAKVPVRVGGSKSKFSKLFFTHFTKEKKNKNKHERDRYLEVLLSLNKKLIQEKINYWKENGLPALIELTTSRIFSSDIQQYNGLPVSQKWILINPTASIREKAWSSENFRQLALKLHEQGHKIAIIGSPKETTWLKEVACEDFIMIQPKNIAELIKVVAQANLLVTNASSMQFIAASTQTPTLTLIGLAEANKWGPLGSWSCFVKGKNLKLKNIFKPQKEINKLNEILSYSSISVSDVLTKIN